jgi:HK97 family phage major capsid protein
MKILELRQTRQALATEARLMIEKCEQERRAMTANEKIKFDGLINQATELGQTIDRAEEAREVEMELSRPIERQSGRGPLGPSGGGTPAAGKLERVAVLGKEARFGDWVQQHQPSAEGSEKLSLGGLMRAMVCGPANDVERRALSEGTDSAGGYMVPNILGAGLIDRLRNRSVCFQAGAQLVPLQSDTTTIASIATDPTASWHTENSTESPSDPTFGAVTFTPRVLMSLVKASRELIEDAPNAKKALETAFAGAMAVELDRVALLGTGTPPEPRGIFNTSGIASVSMGTNGLALSNYDKLIDLWEALATANAPEPYSLVMHPRTAAALAKLKAATTNEPLPVPPLLAPIPKYVTAQIPITQTQGTSNNASSIIGGNFGELLVGVRAQIRIEVLRERYADALQYGFLAYLRADVTVTHNASFGKLIGIIP